MMAGAGQLRGQLVTVSIGMPAPVTMPAPVVDVPFLVDLDLAHLDLIDLDTPRISVHCQKGRGRLHGRGRLRGRAYQKLPVITESRNNVRTQPASRPATKPSAQNPWALVRYLAGRCSYRLREPICYYPSRAAAVAAAAVLIDEVWTTVDVTASVKSKTLGEILALDHLDDDDADEPSTGSSRTHPWKGYKPSIADAGRSEAASNLRVSTLWRVRLAGAGTLTAAAADVQVLCGSH